MGVKKVSCSMHVSIGHWRYHFFLAEKLAASDEKKNRTSTFRRNGHIFLLSQAVSILFSYKSTPSSVWGALWSGKRKHDDDEPGQWSPSFLVSEINILQQQLQTRCAVSIFFWEEGRRSLLDSNQLIRLSESSHSTEIL